MQSICDIIWPLSSRAFDLHLQSTGMIAIVIGNDTMISIIVSSRGRLRQVMLLQLLRLRRIKHPQA